MIGRWELNLNFLECIRDNRQARPSFPAGAPANSGAEVSAPAAKTPSTIDITASTWPPELRGIIDITANTGPPESRQTIV